MQNLQSSPISILSSRWVSKITPIELKTILKYLNLKKAPGIDKIPIKLVKLGSDVLADPLPLASHNSISTSTFSNSVKVTAVLTIDKKTDDKYVLHTYIDLRVY